MRTRSIVFVSLTALVLCGGLVACSSDDTSTPAPSKDAAASNDAAATNDAATDAGTKSDAGGGSDSGSDGGAPKDSGSDADVEAPPPPPISGPRDRAGRPWVSLLLVSVPNQDDYNATPFDGVVPTDPVRDGGTSYGADFQSNLVTLDALDGTDDWKGGSADAGPDDAGAWPHPLVQSWLSLDALLVDPNQPFATDGYLDIERNGAAHATCGGRWPGQDTLDVTMSYLVKAQVTGVSDHVDAPARAPSQTFPYLAPPF